jgi:cytochrome b6-f complex iron-sulfur subunit
VEVDKTTPPGTPEALARAAAAHAKAQGASAVDLKGTPVNKPAVEHLAGAKPKAATATTAAKKKDPELPLPPPQSVTHPRRAVLGFLTLGTTAWLVFFTWLASIHYLFLRFMFPNVLYEADPKFNAGRKNDYPEAPKVYEQYKQSQAVWLVRLTEEGQDRLVALSTVCTHLGCTPNWLETEQKFKCPCHGSGYYIDGVNFEGPTPRPLERFRIFLDAAGNVVVDKSKKFRQDLGQWDENQSYLAMS